MKNIDKYYDAITENLKSTNVQNLGCAVFDMRTGRDDCGDCDCGECCLKRLEWLNQDYKEKILDDVEREYLSAVIKPFRKKVDHIVKRTSTQEEQYIRIVLCNLERINFPYFNKNTGMYKRMEADRLYSLEELGL